MRFIHMKVFQSVTREQFSKDFSLNKHDSEYVFTTHEHAQEDL